MMRRSACAAQAHTAIGVSMTCSLATLAPPMAMMMATMPSIALNALVLTGLKIARKILGHGEVAGHPARDGLTPWTSLPDT
ncbi:MAG TPA: hypothetical protein VFO84_00830 [Dehalococcoidia bacterium]|nr:hypothetical protein [Dehalococcoidia bacterium]